MARPKGTQLIAAERTRQTQLKGWSDEHDMQHCLGELSLAALCYARVANALVRWGPEKVNFDVPDDWPWAEKFWKPSPEPVRNLVKAGALLAAEIDRILLGRELERG